MIINVIIVYLDSLTIESLSIKESVIYPQSNAKTGRAAPKAIAAMDPNIIKQISNLVANRKSSQKLTSY